MGNGDLKHSFSQVGCSRITDQSILMCMYVLWASIGLVDSCWNTPISKRSVLELVLMRVHEVA